MRPSQPPGRGLLSLKRHDDDGQNTPGGNKRSRHTGTLDQYICKTKVNDGTNGQASSEIELPASIDTASSEQSGHDVFTPKQVLDFLQQPINPDPPKDPLAAPPYKKKVWNDKNLDKLREHGLAIRNNAHLDGSYFIPEKLLRQDLKIWEAFDAVLTVRPKSKKFRNKESNPPWPLWHRRDCWIAIPRRFGVEVFGTPTSKLYTNGKIMDFPTPVLPLYNAETCVAANNIDQEKAVTSLVQKLETEADQKGFSSGVFCLSPGYGKTMCMAHAMQRLKRRALYIVPDIGMIDQAVKALQRAFGPGFKIGWKRTSNKREWNDSEDMHVIVSVFNSVAGISYDLSSFGTVVVDECHKTVTPSFSQMYMRFSQRYVVVITGTTERDDHAGGYMEWLVGPLYWRQLRDFSKNRWGGVKVTIINIKCNPMIKEICNKKGEIFQEGITRQIIAHKSRNNYLVNKVFLDRLRKGRHIITLGTRVRHMEHIYERIKDESEFDPGIVVGTHSDGSKLTPEMREEAKQKKLLLIQTSIGCQALDVPQADTLVILCGGCYTGATHLAQAVSRITRDYPDKQPPEFVLIKDVTEGGYLSGLVVAACNTLRKLSPTGFKFSTINVNL